MATVAYDYKPQGTLERDIKFMIIDSGMTDQRIAERLTTEYKYQIVISPNEVGECRAAFFQHGCINCRTVNYMDIDDFDKEVERQENLGNHTGRFAIKCVHCGKVAIVASSQEVQAN